MKDRINGAGVPVHKGAEDVTCEADGLPGERAMIPSPRIGHRTTTNLIFHPLSYANAVFHRHCGGLAWIAMRLYLPLTCLQRRSTG